MGGRSSGGNRSQSKSVTITSSDWDDWAIDPEPYQAVLNGEAIPKRSQADGHEYTKEEIKRFKEIAPKIQELAEATTVDKDTLFRGESYESLLDARRKYKIGATITNSKLTSYATDVDIAKQYAGSNIDFMGKEAVQVVISNTNLNGKSVGVRTDPFGIGGSNEVVTPKGMKSYVKNTHYDKKTNTLYVELGSSAKPRRKK